MDLKELKLLVVKTICPEGSNVEYFKEKGMEPKDGDTIMFREGETISVQLLRDTICFNIVLHNLREMRTEEELIEKIKGMAQNIITKHIRKLEK